MSIVDIQEGIDQERRAQPKVYPFAVRSVHKDKSVYKVFVELADTDVHLDEAWGGLESGVVRFQGQGLG